MKQSSSRKAFYRPPSLPLVPFRVLEADAPSRRKLQHCFNIRPLPTRSRVVTPLIVDQLNQLRTS